MNVKFIKPFVEAAYEVLKVEAGVSVTRGGISLQKSAHTTNDVTVIISMVGQVEGVVFYGMSEQTAINIVSNIIGQPFEEFDELAQSGIGELGNVITGQASRRLFEAGFEADISPPTLLQGKDVIISTLDFQRLLVPLETELGSFEITLALREGIGGIISDLVKESQVQAGT